MQNDSKSSEAFMANSPRTSLLTKGRISRFSFARHEKIRNVHSADEVKSDGGQPFMDLSNHLSTSEIGSTKEDEKMSAYHKDLVEGVTSRFCQQKIASKDISTIENEDQVVKPSSFSKTFIRPLDFSHLKDPFARLGIDRSNRQRRSLALCSTLSKTPSSMSKRFNLTSNLSSRNKETQVRSARKKRQTEACDSVQLQNRFQHLHSKQFARHVREDECRKTLLFDERDEEEAESTHDLAATKILSGNASKSRSRPTPSSEEFRNNKKNTFVVPSIRPPVSRRRSAIPKLQSKNSSESEAQRNSLNITVFKTRRPSVLLSRRSFSSVTLQNKGEEPENELKNPFYSRSVTSEAGENDFSQTMTSPRVMTSSQVKVSPLSQIMTSSKSVTSPSPLTLRSTKLIRSVSVPANTSPGPPPNSPSPIVKSPTPLPLTSAKVCHPKQDASCNTILTGAMFQIPFGEVEGRIEEMRKRQGEILDAVEESLTKMREEFMNRTQNLLTDFRSSYDPILQLQKELKEKLQIYVTQDVESFNNENEERTALGNNDVAVPSAVTEEVATESADGVNEELNCAVPSVVSEEVATESADGVNEEPKLCKTQNSTYKFLGTPLSKKSKKSKLTRSLSHPPSPEGAKTSPRSRESSFHSIESDASPFSAFVGDCDRPSLAFVTPRTRGQASRVKSAFNEQLQSLYEK